jgi:hypothetical protein
MIEKKIVKGGKAVGTEQGKRTTFPVKPPRRDASNLL